jgi:hypothetical protein
MRKWAPAYPNLPSLGFLLDFIINNSMLEHMFNRTSKEDKAYLLPKPLGRTVSTSESFLVLEEEGTSRMGPSSSLPSKPLTNHLGEAVLQPYPQATANTLGSRIALRSIAFLDISTNP